jgi:3-phenylpropionate/cinnamic acid dioxygenase small subunit
MDRLEQLIAKAEIEECLCRYARGVDRRDWPMVRAGFHDDATDQHGEFTGNADEFIVWVSRRHADVPFSMHFLGKSLVEFLSDRVAAVETYFIAFQRRTGHGASATEHEVFGRYVDRFERRGDDVWRVARRQVVYDSTGTHPSTNHLRQTVGTLGRRDSLDPVYGNRQ